MNTADPPSAGFCIWFFTDDTTLTGLPIGLQVSIDGEGDWIDPIDAAQTQPNSIACYYATGETLDGKDYRIVAAPSGILQAARIVIPAGGVVEAP